MLRGWIGLTAKATKIAGSSGLYMVKAVIQVRILTHVSTSLAGFVRLFKKDLIDTTSAYYRGCNPTAGWKQLTCRGAIGELHPATLGGNMDRTPWITRNTCLERMKVVILQESQLRLQNILAMSEEAQINLATEFFAEGMTSRLVAVLAGERIRVLDVQYPADWIEAIKERFLPFWLKKRWPIRYTRLAWDIRVVYPEVSLPKEVHTVLDAVPVRELIGGLR